MTGDDSHPSSGRTVTLRLRHVVIALVIVAVGVGTFIALQVGGPHSARNAGQTTAPLAIPRVEPSDAVNESPAYRPATFGLAADGTAYMSGITWQSWTAHRATGRGVLHVRSRTLGYAGTWSSKPSDIVLSKPVKTRHGLLFTSVRIGGGKPWALSTALPTVVATTSTTQPPNGATSLRGYLASLTNGVIFLQWTQQGETLSGSGQAAYLSTNGAQVTSEHETVSGTIDGSSMTLSVEPDGLYGTVDLSGSMQGSGFLLSIPGSNGALVPVQFSSATAADYDTAIAALQTEASQTAQNQQAAAASRAAEHKVAQDVSTVEQALSTVQSASSALTGDVSTIRVDVQQEGSDLAQTTKDLAATLAAVEQYGVGSGNGVCYDATQNVEYDATQNVEYDATQNVEYDVTGLKGDIGTVQSDVAQLQADFQQLHSDEAAVPNYLPAGAPANSAVSHASAAAQGAMSSAVSQANTLIGLANEDVTAAYSDANKAIAAGHCGSSVTTPSPLPTLPPPAL